MIPEPAAVVPEVNLGVSIRSPVIEHGRAVSAQRPMTAVSAILQQVTNYIYPATGDADADRITRTTRMVRPLAVTPQSRRRLSFADETADEPGTPTAPTNDDAAPGHSAADTLTPEHEAQLRSLPAGDVSQAMAQVVHKHAVATTSA